MKRLLKKEITLVPAKVLNMRYCRILEKAEKLRAQDIPVADAREILWIEDELRRRLITFIGHDFYPPDRIESKPTIKFLGGGKIKMKPVPKPEKKKPISCNISNERKQPYPKAEPPPQGKLEKPPLKPIKPELTPGTKIKLRIVISTSLGVKAAEFTVEVDSRSEADLLANKQIRELGLKGATYKIS